MPEGLLGDVVQPTRSATTLRAVGSSSDEGAPLSPFQPSSSAPLSIETMSPAAEHAVARDAVHDVLVDRRADRVPVAGHQHEVGHSPAVADRLSRRWRRARRVVMPGRTTRPDGVERRRRQQPGRDHDAGVRRASCRCRSCGTPRGLRGRGDGRDTACGEGRVDARGDLVDRCPDRRPRRAGPARGTCRSREPVSRR